MNLGPAQNQLHQNTWRVDHIAGELPAGFQIQLSPPPLQELSIETNQDQEGAAVQIVTRRCEIPFDKTRYIRGCKVRGWIAYLHK